MQVQYESPQQKSCLKEEGKRKNKNLSLKSLHDSQHQGSINTCEAQLFGEKTQFKVLGMRGEVVKIRIGFRVRLC